MPRPPAAASAHAAATRRFLLVADVVSYGYAAVAMWATLQFDLAFQLWQGVLLMVLFVLLRAVAHELRRELRRVQLEDARRRAAIRVEGPARWSVEQRDGLGRRVDVGA